MPKESSDDRNVWLDGVEIAGFRSCHHTVVRPNLDLTALIGVNGAGKTNVLHAIRLLRARTGRGIFPSGRDAATPDEVLLTAWFRVGEHRVGLKVKLMPDASRREGELFTVEELWNFGSLTGSRVWRSMAPFALLHESTHLGGRVRSVVIDSSREFVQYIAPGRVRALKDFDPTLGGNRQVMATFKAIADFRAGISYYSASQFTDPTRCPTNFEVDEDGRLVEQYTTTALSHLRFLHDLYQLKKKNRSMYDEFCRFVSRRQLGLVSRIVWKEIELSSSAAEVRHGGGVKKIRKRKTLVIPKVQVGSARITFNQLSEGTFKTLALAFYVVTDASRFLMVEEPEVCVHYGLLSRLVDTLKAYSHRKQIIISTHSDQLVDALEPNNIHVVEMQSGNTQVTPLNNWLDSAGKQALHTYLAETGSLGEYWRSGGLS